ncbi:MAG: VOC family protein [Anaerolineae bacterium]|nr:VOC family protein [Anaerolineae bacterium]
MSHPNLKAETICQVGIIVHDIERTAQKYCEVFGFPPPQIVETAGFAQSKTTYNGQPSEATAKLAFFNAGQVTIELIQPDEKPSVWREFLEQHGEGVHHIAFQIKDTEAVTGYLAENGAGIAQQGLYSDGSGVYTYVDTGPLLGTMFELLENFPRS